MEVNRFHSKTLDKCSIHLSLARTSIRFFKASYHILSSKEFGGVSPLSSLIENYDKITNDVFKIRARSVGTEHEDMLVQTDSYMTVWMLYQLQDDKEASKIFVGDDAEILHNKKWQDIEKNK